MREGIEMGAVVQVRGGAPYVPWLDHDLLLQPIGCRLTVEDMYESSLAWLEVADALYVVRGWENSKGTKAEIEVAKALGIPIFYSLEEVSQYIEREGKKYANRRI